MSTISSLFDLIVCGQKTTNVEEIWNHICKEYHHSKPTLRAHGAHFLFADVLFATHNCRFRILDYSESLEPNLHSPFKHSQVFMAIIWIADPPTLRSEALSQARNVFRTLSNKNKNKTKKMQLQDRPYQMLIVVHDSSPSSSKAERDQQTDDFEDTEEEFAVVFPTLSDAINAVFETIERLSLYVPPHISPSTPQFSPINRMLEGEMQDNAESTRRSNSQLRIHDHAHAFSLFPDPHMVATQKRGRSIMQISPFAQRSANSFTSEGKQKRLGMSKSTGALPPIRFDRNSPIDRLSPKFNRAADFSQAHKHRFDELIPLETDVTQSVKPNTPKKEFRSLFCPFPDPLIHRISLENSQDFQDFQDFAHRYARRAVMDSYLDYVNEKQKQDIRECVEECTSTNFDPRSIRKLTTEESFQKTSDHYEYVMQQIDRRSLLSVLLSPPKSLHASF